MRLEDLGAVDGDAQVRAGGVDTFRRAEDESRGTVGRVRCALCPCSGGARDPEVEIVGGSDALVGGGEMGTCWIDGEVGLEDGRLIDGGVVRIEKACAVCL